MMGNERSTQASGAITSFSEDSAFPAERGDTNNQLEPSESEEKDGGSGAGAEIERSKDWKIEREAAEKRVTLGGADPKYVSLDETILGADRVAGPAIQRPTWKF